MIRACLLLLAGFYGPQLISFNSASDLLAGAFVAGFVTIFLPLLRLAAWLLPGAVLFTIAAVGVVDSRLAPDLVGDSIVVDATVEEFPRKRKDTVTFVVRPVTDSRLPARLRVSWFEPPVEIRLGDRWQFELRLRRPRGTSNPGAFDYEAWLFRESIGAVGYVVNSHRNHLLRSGPGGLIDATRQRFADRVVNVVPDPGQAAVIAAVVVGARHLLTDQQWERYAHTGTTHLMAISGLHIGLAASGGYVIAAVLLGAMRFRSNQHAAAIVAGLLVAVLYALVSGWGIPARRAVLMLALTAIILLRRRRPLPWRVVASACLVVAILSPLASMAPGFVLSFGAVVVLLWIAQRRSPMSLVPASMLKRLCRGSTDLARLQLGLLCGLLPATGLLFGRVAFAAPLVNLLAVPVFSAVVVPVALLGFVFDGCLRPAGDALLELAAWTIGGLEWVIGELAALDWTAFDMPAMAGNAHILAWLPACWLLLPRAWPGRAIAWIAMLALVTHVPGRPAGGCVDAEVLDVGQGLAVLLRTRSKTMLYDTGPAYRSGGSAMEMLIVPLLRRLRVSRLDYLVVTHGDNDHAGGVESLLAAVPVDELLVGERLPGIDAPQRRCDSNMRWSVDGVDFRFLHPAPGSSLHGNDASCVLQVTAGEQQLLLTGDIEKIAEARLVERGMLQEVDVITVPHHGSRTSSTPAFVAALKPDLAIVANGFGNRWGMPKPDVVARWQATGAELLQTADSGAIRVTFCTGTSDIRVRRHRAARHRIWHE